MSTKSQILSAVAKKLKKIKSLLNKDINEKEIADQLEAAYQEWQSIEEFNPQIEAAQNLYALSQSADFSEDNLSLISNKIAAILKVIENERVLIDEEDESDETEGSDAREASDEEESEDVASENDDLNTTVSFTDDEEESDAEQASGDEEPSGQSDSDTEVESESESEEGLINKINANGDDSSDEETSSRAIKKYDITKALKKLEADQEEDTLEDDVKFSFMAHALGIEVLYSSSVNQEYYQNHKLKISSQVSLQLKNAFESCIQLALEEIAKTHKIKLPVTQFKDVARIAEQWTLKVAQYIINNRGEENILSESLSDLDLSEGVDKLAIWLKEQKPSVDQAKLNKALSKLLEKKIQEKIPAKIYRQILPSNYVYASNNSSGFFANLRLNHRSQMHAVRNYESSTLGSMGAKCVVKWQLTLDPDSIIDESQELSYNQKRGGFGRAEIVMQMDTYKSILVQLQTIQETFKEHKIPAKDKDIADYIRKIFKGEIPLWYRQSSLSTADKKKILEFFSGITYLLLGCECRRNPGLIVINQMLLDLIAANQLSWKEALQEGTKEKGGIMPMAPSGAIAIGRSLNSFFNDYMPRPYNYLGEEKEKFVKKKGKKIVAQFDVDLLRKYETAIVKRWLNYKDPASLERPIAEIAEFIKGSYSQWFSFSVALPVNQEAASIPSISR